MKVCFFSETAAPLELLAGGAVPRGGAEKQIGCLMAYLAGKAHEVTLVHGGPDRRRPAAVSGIESVRTPLSLRDPRSVAKLLALLRELQPEAVYARLPHDFLAAVAGYARLSKRTRLVFGLANDAFCDPWRAVPYHPWLHNSLYALTLRWSDVVVVQHEGQRALVRPHVRREIRHLPNLVDRIDEQPRPLASASWDAVWISHVRPQKQLEVFLDVAEALPHLQFAVVGAFDSALPRETVQTLGDRMAAAPNVEHLGLLRPAEARSVVRSAKVLVNTSRHEGFPNAMLEAWSSGCPVVSLTVDPGGVIRRESLGLVSGSPEQLRDDVERLATSSSLNERLGTNGLRYVRAHHSPEVVGPAFERLLVPSAGAQLPQPVPAGG